MTRTVRVLAIVCFALSMAGLRVSPAHAAMALTVTDCTQDSGPGTLRAAVAQANDDNVNDAITFSCSGTVTLYSTLSITGSMTIDGSGRNVIVDGNKGYRIFSVSAVASLGLSNLTLQNGRAFDIPTNTFQDGGAIRNYGTLTIANSTVSNNTGYEGGAILNDGGSLTVTHSTLSGNDAKGDGGVVDNVNFGTLTVSNSNLSGNYSGGSLGGGAIANGAGTYTDAGTVTVTQSTLSNNQAYRTDARGGAIANAGVPGRLGTVTVSDSTLSGNHANGYGGAVDNLMGTATVVNSILSGNNVNSSGGAIDSNGPLTVTSSTFSGNSAAEDGGGIAIANSTYAAPITNSTFVGNSAWHGGAIAAISARIFNSTLVGNSVLDDTTGAIFNEGLVTLGGSIVAGNSVYGGAKRDCDSIATDAGYNLSTDNNCLRGATGDRSVQDPGIALDGSGNPLLADNGGPTSTIALQPNSAAIDKIPAASCPATDQRGLTRPDGGETACDIGAYEYDGPDRFETCPRDGAALSSDIGVTDAVVTVTLSCAGATTIPFTSPLTISRNVTLDASGSPGAITLDGGSSTQLFQVQSGGSLTLNHLTLSHGHSSGNGPPTAGGAIYNAGTLTFTHGTISDSSATNGYGGAIFNGTGGNATITRSTLSGNSTDSSGGAVFSFNATLTIIDSLLSNNTAPTATNGGGNGGAVDSSGSGAVEISGSTLAGNSAAYGGAVAQENGALTITNSTFSDNSADYTPAPYLAQGGAIWNFGSATIANSTFSGNSAPSAGEGNTIYTRSFYGVQMSGTIISGVAGHNCFNDWSGVSGFTDGGYNLEWSGRGNADTCGFGSANHDVTGQDPGLDPNGLQSNGGPTQTIALQRGSPAVDQIPTAGCPATDQRGTARPDDGESKCDIGSYEFNGLDLPVQQAQTITWTGPAQTAYTYGDAAFTVSATASSGLPVSFGIDSGSSNVCSAGGTNGATITILAPGTCTVLANQAGNSSYLAAPRASQNFTIARADLHVTANDKAMTYGGAVPGFDAAVTGLANGDTFASLGGTCTATVGGNAPGPTTPVGTYSGAITCYGVDTSNYTVSYTTGALTIRRAPLIVTANDQTVQYGSAPPPLTVHFSDFVNNQDSSVLGGTLQCSTTAAVNGSGQVTSPAGAYTITCSGLTASNYQITYGPGTLTVTNPGPTTSSLSPATIKAASGSTTLTISGSNFVPQSMVRVTASSGSVTALTPTSVSSDGTSLSVAVPSTSLAIAGTIQVQVINAAPGGGASNLQPLFVTAALTAVSAESVSTTGTATVGGLGSGTPGSVTLTASGGSGNVTVAVAQYSTDPGGTPNFGSTGAYFDAYVAPGSTYTTVRIVDCTLDGGSQAWWWNGTIWDLASNQTYDASTGCITITVNATTYPTLDQLTGTEFGIANVPPTLSVPGGQSVQYSDRLSFQVSASNPEPGDKITLSATGLPAGLTFKDNGTGIGTVSGAVTAAAGSYSASFTANDGHSTSTAQTVAITVSQENTVVKPAQNNLSAVPVTKAGGTAPAITVSARVTEVADSAFGDITRASPITFALNPIGSGSTSTCKVPSSSGSITQTVAATSTSPGFEVASCTFPAGVSVNVYELTVSVGGSYYQGSADSVLTVYNPSQTGVQSGGGMVTNPKTGNTVSFGFSAQSVSGGNVQGKMLYVETDSGGKQVAVLKGNVMSAMAVTKTNGTYPETAKITGKATLNGTGNYSYILQGVDSAGTATDADQYGIMVTDPTGAGIPALTFTPQTLLTTNGVQSGDIYVK